MPKRKVRKLPSKIVNYLRVLVCRIRSGVQPLPVSLYLNIQGTRISKINKGGWDFLIEIDDINFVDFDLLYNTIEYRIREMYSEEKSESISDGF
jgi:hypothetical protein